MADPITMISLGLTALGGATTAAGTIVSGQNAKAADEFKAAQLEQAAGEARAVGQAGAFERRRQAKLTLSSLQARSAASGGDASDPSIIKLGEQIAKRGEYQALSEMWTGEQKGRGLIDASKAARMEGDAAVEGSYYSAAGTVLSSAGSMAKTYGTMNRTGTPRAAADYG